MKKYFKSIAVTIIITFFLGIQISCSNSDDNGNNGGNSQNYFIKTKINGELTEYKIDASAVLEVNGNRISAFAKSTNNQPFPSFDFEITDLTGIKVQNYSEANPDLIFRWAKEGTVTYISTISEAFNINITEITDSYIKGTFNGKLTLAQSNDIVNLTLTEGEFFLKRNLE